MTAAISTIDTATSQEAAKVLTHDLTMASNLVSGDLLQFSLTRQSVIDSELKSE